MARSGGRTKNEFPNRTVLDIFFGRSSFAILHWGRPRFLGAVVATLARACRDAPQQRNPRSRERGYQSPRLFSNPDSIADPRNVRRPRRWSPGTQRTRDVGFDSLQQLRLLMVEAKLRTVDECPDHLSESFFGLFLPLLEILTKDLDFLRRRGSRERDENSLVELLANILQLPQF